MIDPFALPEPIGRSKTKDYIRELRRTVRSLKVSFGKGERGLVTQNGFSRVPMSKPASSSGGGGTSVWG